MKIDYILIPQGQEFKKVQKGFHLAKVDHPPLIPIPMGIKPVNLFLKSWLNQVNFQHGRVLLLGLGGALSPDLKIGDLTIYDHCYLLENQDNFNQNILPKNCDFQFNHYLKNSFHNQCNYLSFLVEGITSPRLINLAKDKQKIFQQTQAQVVDMEAWTILNNLDQLQIKLSVLRVISDDSTHNIPNLNNALTPQGKLKPLALALDLISDFQGGLTLIKGSLTALKILEKVAFNLGQILR